MAVTWGVYSLEPLEALGAGVALLSEMVRYSPHQGFRAIFEARVASPGVRFGLLGFVCEPIGKEVSAAVGDKIAY